MPVTKSLKLCVSKVRCVRACADTSRRDAAHVAPTKCKKACAHSGERPVPLNRRALGAVLLAPALNGAEGLVRGAQASTVDFNDKEDGFTLAVPKDWSFTVPQQAYDRFRAGVSTTRTLVWLPESGTDVNVSIVITTPGADYTSLASFGSASDFGANLVASMDRSFMRGKGDPADVQVVQLVAAASDGPAYGIEYTIQRGSEEQKHLYSRVLMGSNGRFRRFYTITATCPESQTGEMGPVLKAAVASLVVDKVA